MTVNDWWFSLCALGVANLAAWVLSARTLAARRQAMDAQVYRTRRLLMWLSGVYVAGCAYRCFFLVYDVPRICLIDTWLSSVLVGRSVATLAELCFVAQWAVMLRESSRATGSMTGKCVSLALVPLIAVAEICSWYSVLSTSNLGHTVEESIWGLSVLLLVVSVSVSVPRASPARRPALVAWCVAGLTYVTFMFTVDVPMYWSRWVADETSARHYLSLLQGIVDVAKHRVVSHQWADWKNEVVWMSLYFSLAVWISISFIHAPALKPTRVVRNRLRLLPTPKFRVSG